MGVQFTSAEGRALYGLLAETTNDIVLRIDRAGFIVHASPAIERLGLALPRMLFAPHISELAVPDYADELRAELGAAIEGAGGGRWIEFPARMADAREAWFEIQFRPLGDGPGGTYGAIAIMRSIDERRILEAELFAATMTDPLTGLTNRRAFLAMLGHLVGGEAGGSLAMFSIDHFKAINMRYGQSTGDKVLVAFADFLRAALRADDTISRIGNQRFAVLLPRTAPERAAEVCGQAVTTLAELARGSGDDGLPVTASVGLGRIGGSIDASVKRAELALFFARAKGRNRLEIYGEEALLRAA